MIEVRQPELAAQIAELLRAAMLGIVPDRVYPAEEAADLLGIRSERRAQTLREIPRELLPDVPVTPGGRIVGYLGRDLLNYIELRRRTS